MPLTPSQAESGTNLVHAKEYGRRPMITDEAIRHVLVDSQKGLDALDRDGSLEADPSAQCASAPLRVSSLESRGCKRT